jgi:hypothetical protein
MFAVDGFAHTLSAPKSVPKGDSEKSSNLFAWVGRKPLPL